MKVIFVLPRMVSGGVERVSLNLIAEFCKAGHDCALALRKAHGELLDEARSLTEVHELAPDGLHQFVPRLVKQIGQWQPTHVVTAFADVAAMTWGAIRLARSGARWIHGVHNTHASVTRREGVWGKPRYWLDTRLARFVYRHADALVAVSEGVRTEVLEQFQVAPERVGTIFNPVVPDDQLHEVKEPRHAPDQPSTIVAMGRLTRQKGFDVLIKAMKDVPQPWRLDIWGDGEERSNLESIIAKHGMQRSIRLRGFTTDQYTVLRNADLFVLPSRYEGLPTVLIEALACQCSIVSTDCPHGPREILLNGKLGRLVPPQDSHQLSQAIHDALVVKSRVSTSALLERAQQFTLDVAAKKWLQVMDAT